jgi:hypothetical protein
MMVQANLADLEEYIAVRMTAPSPLVGEGITNGRPKLNRVRGTVSQTAVRRQPLTRLRFAKPPSPTRGEGKNPATQRRQPA